MMRESESREGCANNHYVKRFWLCIHHVMRDLLST
jgi:hypothetical protein